MSASRTVRAWGVHALTAAGAVVGLATLLAVADGRFAHAALLMLLAFWIDAVDGSLARAARVAEVVPHIDGRRLDDVVDYLNYVIVPAFFMVEAGSVAGWGWVAFPVLASAYGFSQTDAKTDDDFFVGFPSYWNVLAIYLWLLEIGPAAGTLWVVGLSAAVFVPIKFLYPSKMPVQRVANLVAASVWFWFLVAAVIWESQRARLGWGSLVYVAYYWLASLHLGGWHRRTPPTQRTDAA